MEVDLMRAGYPKTNAFAFVTLFIISALIFGTAGLAYIGSEEYKQSQRYLTWMNGLGAIITLYMVAHARYYLPIIMLPIRGMMYGDTTPRQEIAILGRTVCFLLFPSFASTIAVAVWLLTKRLALAAFTGLIVGWLITLVLQKSIFAHEYANRKHPLIS
jgi:hypothetical protein